KLIAQGRFRADLYYRLNVFSIHLPPLRSRGEDLPLLIDHLLRRFRRELGRPVERIADDAHETLCRYSWPGNVPELESTLKQMILQAGGPVLVQDDLPVHMRNAVRTDPALLAIAGAGFDMAAFTRERIATGSSDLYAEVLVQVETFLLREVLRRTGG